MNMKKWAEDIINSGQKKALPVLTYPGLEMAGKTILEVVKDGSAQFECIKALASRYPSLATVTIMDLSVEAEALGSNIRFGDNDVPTVIGKLVETEEDANNLKVPSMETGRMKVYVEAARLAVENIEDRIVLGGCIGPYSLGGRLMDMTEIMCLIIEDPDLVKIVLEKASEFIIEFIKEYKKAGANGIIIAEPAAGLLSPGMCGEFSSVYLKKIIDAVQDDEFMVILHNCGNTVKLVPSMLSTGAKAFHFGDAVDMTEILPQIPEDILVFGNISPSNTFKNGNPEVMRSQVLKLLEDMKPYKNFVLSSGCDVPPGTPIENVDAFYAALEEYNKLNG